MNPTPPPHSPVPSVKRYDIEVIDHAYEAAEIVTTESPQGAWVRHSDFAALQSQNAALVEALKRIEREARTEYIAKIATDALAGHDRGRDLETAIHDALVMLPASRYDRETNDALNAVRDRLSEALSHSTPTRSER